MNTSRVLRPFLSIALLLALVDSTGAADTISLQGQWAFRLDPTNEGIKAQWYSKAMPETVRLPGCLQEQGKGFTPGPQTEWWLESMGFAKLAPEFPFLDKYNQPTNYCITAFLLPMKHYIGPAWYAREVQIPAAWAGRRITLFLERCHWETRLWVDGRESGHRDSLAAPHEYDLTDFVSPGRHRLVLRVDNGHIVDIGGKPHSVSDQTAGTWNGIVGRVELRSTPAVWLDDLQIYPDVLAKKVTAKGFIGNRTGKPGKGIVRLSITASAGGKPATEEIPVTWPAEGGSFTAGLALSPNAPVWDEFHPVLHELTVSLNGATERHQLSIRFGIREFKTEGRQFTINGRPVFLRGNVDCAVFPKTGYAPMTIEAWRRIWALYKEWGFNQARFHSWCPPEAAFAAADEAGIYLAPEVDEWCSVRSPEQEDFFRRESKAMLHAYGNHPSFVMLGLGNEMGGDKAIFQRLLAEWKKDPRHVYSIKANSQANPPEADYEVARVVGGKQLRYQIGWPPKPLNTLLQKLPPQTILDWRDAVAQSPKPLLAHETGQFCSYPDVLNEPDRFTGYLKPSYLRIARDQLNERGMLGQVPDFVRASGQWQVALYKEEIEADFRTPGMGGFNLLQLNDFTGQNTAPVGLLDATWKPKPYVSAKEFRQFCGPTVLLARMQKRVWTTREKFNAVLEMTHYGTEPLTNQAVQAVIRNRNGKEVMRTLLPPRDFALGTAQPAGELTLALAGLKAPAKYTLHLSLPSRDVHNQWDWWLYPPSVDVERSKDLLVTHSFDESARQHLSNGGLVLLLAGPGELTGNLPICFTTFYWTTFGLTGGQSSACGLLCDPEHPVFQDFPTESRCNWQWWDLLTSASPMILDEPGRQHPWPKTYRPLVQMIDGWKTNRKLAVLAEGRLGRGRLVICSMDIENNLEQRPVARQFRASLLLYLQSKDFHPRDEVTPEMVTELFGGGRSSQVP